MNSGKKSKGFIFSADAVFAIVLVLAIAGILLAGEKAKDPSGDALKFLDSKTRDYSVVGFYLNKTAVAPMTSTIDFSKSSAKCNSIYVLSLGSTSGQTPPIPNRFCDAK